MHNGAYVHSNVDLRPTRHQKKGRAPLASKSTKARVTLDTTEGKSAYLVCLFVCLFGLFVCLSVSSANLGFG